MSKNNFIAHLKIVLADSYALYLKTQNYHWNVEGQDFYSLHLLFESQYKELATAIDLIAELIRSYGDKVAANFMQFNNATCITPANENSKAKDMLKELAEDNVKIQNNLQVTLEAAQDAKDEVCVDAMIERLTAHRKAAWMLKSSL